MVKGPFMEFLNLYGEQSGVDVNTTTMFATPTSKTENLAMLIHQIHYQLDTYADPDADFLIGVVNKQLASAFTLHLDDQECVDLMEQRHKFTTSGATDFNADKTHYFDPPILYTKQNIGIHIESNSSGATKEGWARIGYTLEKVDKDDYIAALVV